MRTREPRSFNADYPASLSPCGAKTRRLIAVFVLETNYMGVKVAQREYGNATAAMIWLPCKRGSARHLEERFVRFSVGERASNGIHVSPFAWRPAQTPSTSRLSTRLPSDLARFTWTHRTPVFSMLCSTRRTCMLVHLVSYVRDERRDPCSTFGPCTMRSRRQGFGHEA